MTDRNELRRLAEAVKTARAALVGHVCTYEGGVGWCQSPLHDDMIEAIDAFRAAASPDVVLGLLDELERLKGECDFFSARSEEERTNRGLAENDFHDAMELVRQYSAERDHLRAALESIATHNPAVAHGWADHVREMARNALKAR